jgi:hypothetical protein
MSLLSFFLHSPILFPSSYVTTTRFGNQPTAMISSPWGLLTLLFFSLAISLFPHAHAAGETSIWINEIPLYTSLAPCALDRVSAIIRAQASGCNDDSAHTSFACFCIESSSAFSSIISTAVAQQCSRQEAMATPSSASVIRRRGAVVRQAVAAPTGDVSSALEVWESYCAKSTMLDLCSSPSPSSLTLC